MKLSVFLPTVKLVIDAPFGWSANILTSLFDHREFVITISLTIFHSSSRS